MLRQISFIPTKNVTHTYVAPVTSAQQRMIGMNRRQRIAKRALDLAVGSVALFLSLPVMLLVAIAIRIESKGPVLFRQRRVGEGGRFFQMYKFRSMVVNAEAYQAGVNRTSPSGQTLHKHRGDPRVTRVGRFIRKTSLDELPQLLNVLRGDMSLVGPRPELPWLVEQYESWQRERFLVPQGITGWWQITGRSDKPCHLSTDDDVYYIRNYSLWMDIKIIARTIPALFKGKGAF